MTTNVTRLLSAAALAAVFVPAAASAAGAADLPTPKVTSDGPNRVIVVHAHRTAGTFTPDGGSTTTTFPTAAPKAGDAFTFVDDLMQNGTKVGTDHGRCTIKGTDSSVCQATLTFADGSLHSGGPSPQSSGPYSIPITAGTGAYSGATGTAHVNPVGTAAQYNESDVTLTFAAPGTAPGASTTGSGASTTGSGASTTGSGASTTGSGASSSSTPAVPSSPKMGGSQVTTVPHGGAAAGTGSTAGAGADESWLLLLGTTGIVASAGVLLASGRSRRAAR